MSKSDLEISAKYWEAEAEKARKRANRPPWFLSCSLENTWGNPN
jgi:hypothetical protein